MTALLRSDSLNPRPADPEISTGVPSYKPLVVSSPSAGHQSRSAAGVVQRQYGRPESKVGHTGLDVVRYRVGRVADEDKALVATERTGKAAGTEEDIRDGSRSGSRAGFHNGSRVKIRKDSRAEIRDDSRAGLLAEVAGRAVQLSVQRLTGLRLCILGAPPRSVAVSPSSSACPFPWRTPAEEEKKTKTGFTSSDPIILSHFRYPVLSFLFPSLL